MFRLLTTELLWDGIIAGCNIVIYDGETIIVKSFEKETHSTIFVPGPVAVLDSLKFDEFVIDDIEMMINASGGVPDEKRLDDYIKSSSLYYCNASGSEPVFLKLGRRCQIIPMS